MLSNITGTFMRDVLPLYDKMVSHDISPLPTQQSVLNPLGLSAVTFGVIIVAKFFAEELLDTLLVTALKLSNHALLPSRVPVPMMKGLEALGAVDCLYLCVNQFVECVFLMHLISLGLALPRALAAMTLLNTVAAFYLTFLVDDFVYYLAHRLMHHPWLYPYCHKHHHRQPLPRRGYLDAANENPLEQVIGLGCVWFAVHVTMALVGCHAATTLVFFVTYASLAMLNHTPYDVQLGFVMLGYNVRAHEMHHRIPRSNYAQNTMIFDRMLGTFQQYSVPASHQSRKEQ
jgi:sterol desaturase/sphingolipid hydroxylase (fatty acid hydroxylase superfamily)